MAQEGAKKSKRGASKGAKRPRGRSKIETQREEARRNIISRAVVDPAFREKLFRNPARVFGTRLTAEDRAALKRIQASLPLLDAQLTHLAGTILCVDDPPDPIA